MKSIDLALAALEIRESDLTPETKAIALEGLPQLRLRTGEAQLAIIQHIDQRITEGHTRAYAIRSAADLHHVSQRHAERIYDTFDPLTCRGLPDPTAIASS